MVNAPKSLQIADIGRIGFWCPVPLGCDHLRRGRPSRHRLSDRVPANTSKEIARRRLLSPSDLIKSIDSERLHDNLSSAIRVFVTPRLSAQTLRSLLRGPGPGKREIFYGQSTTCTHGGSTTQGRQNDPGAAAYLSQLGHGVDCGTNPPREGLLRAANASSALLRGWPPRPPHGP